MRIQLQGTESTQFAALAWIAGRAKVSVVDLIDSERIRTDARSVLAESFIRPLRFGFGLFCPDEMSQAASNKKSSPKVNIFFQGISPA